MKVHPLADRLPMLSQEDLEELAESIAARGLNHPIVLDKDGVLIDGRNRLAACKIAGVEPTFTTWEGDDVGGFILDENIYRRQLPKSIKVMATALVYPEAKHGGDRKKNKSSCVTQLDLEKAQLSHARAIIREFGADSEAVQYVMAGGSLEEMYYKAQEQKKLKQQYEQQLEEFKAQLSKMGGASLTVLTELEPLPFSFEEATNSLPQMTYASKLEGLKKQQLVLGSLTVLGEQVEEMANRPIVEDGLAQEMFVASIYAAVNEGIAAYKKIADNYKKTLSRPQIRKVK